jgi:Lrp/AsnC family leucine-responsive transcriptional regulator
MNKSAMTNKLDRSDRAILRELQADGRISNKALATKVHLSPPACHARMKRLTEEGYIRGYKPILDRRKLGLDNLCFIELSLEVHQQERIGEILDGVVSLPEVLECYHLTGEYDYLLKVAVRDTDALHRFISGRLVPVPGIARVHTSLVLKEIKSAGALPVE